MEGSVQQIHITPDKDATPESVDAVEAVAGAGLRGDRYFDEDGTSAGSDLTLIESEAIVAAERDHGISLDPGAHRRNVTTEGVPLNDFVDERLQVGEAVCVGTELYHPCSHLERQVGTDGVCEALDNRGGLCCRIVENGQIRVGDEVGPTAGD